MKQFLTFLFISAGILGFTTANAQKIGYISADEIIQLMPEAHAVQTELDQYQQSLYQNAEDKRAAFDEAVQKFFKDSSAMSASMKEVKRTELQKQNADLGQDNQRIQNQFQMKQAELAAPIQKKLQAAIEEVAKENGFTYVFQREALIVMPPSSDMGPLVKKKLNLKDAPAPALPGAK
jgi:outer membrane protein